LPERKEITEGAIFLFAKQILFPLKNNAHKHNKRIIFASLSLLYISSKEATAG
jgi:hypothetical protein